MKNCKHNWEEVGFYDSGFGISTSNVVKWCRCCGSIKKNKIRCSRAQRQPRLTVVTTEDWEGLFIDDRLAYENHSIPLNAIAKAGNMNIEYVHLPDDEDLADHGFHFPQRLSDLKRTK